MQTWQTKQLNSFFSNRRNLLLGIIFLSLILRLFSAYYLGNTVEELPGTFDQISYHNLAVRVLEGHGFTFGETWWPITPAGEPTAHWSFLYTLYLVGVYAVFGVKPLVARIIQVLLVGTIQPFLAYLIGKKLFRENIGLWAAFITAAYIYFVYYSAALMTEMFYISAILAGFYLAIRFTEGKNEIHEMRFGIGFGVILGVIVLLRQLFILFVPFFLLWLGWSYYRHKKRIPVIGLGISLLILAGMIIPFTYFNYLRFNQFVLLNTNSGYAFFWGNHPIYGSKFVPILTAEMGSYQDLIPQEVRHLDEASLDKELLRRGIQFVVDDPLRYVLLSISRIPAFFMFWPSPQSGLISNISRTGSFGLFLPFMVLGLIQSYSQLAKRMHKSLLAFMDTGQGLLLLFMLFYTGVHLLTWALVRYRLPVDSVLIIYAGVGVAYCVEYLHKRIFPQQV
jgi:4-amino-4-deoxy-L-arabinose transferase-like glycosyltransferase